MGKIPILTIEIFQMGSFNHQPANDEKSPNNGNSNSPIHLLFQRKVLGWTAGFNFRDVDLIFRDGFPRKAHFLLLNGNQKSQGDHHRLDGAKTRRIFNGRNYQPRWISAIKSVDGSELSWRKDHLGSNEKHLGKKCLDQTTRWVLEAFYD